MQNLTKGQKLIFGFFTLSPFIGIIALLSWFGVVFSELMDSTTHGSAENFDQVFAEVMLPFAFGSLAIGLISLVMTVLYVIHQAKNPGLSSDMRVVWILLTLFFNLLPMTIYFFLEIWPERSPQEDMFDQSDIIDQQQGM